MTHCLSDTGQRIIQHYSRTNLSREVDSFIHHYNRNNKSIPVSDLLRFDQIHMGGRFISEMLLQNISLDSSALICDAGCGLGGSSRLLAEKYNCRVVSVDLNHLYCHCGQKLSHKCFINPVNSFVTADMTSIPLNSNIVDLLWCQHIIMNIENKEKLFKEFHRIMKEGSILVLHEVFRKDNSPLYYPVPWAATENESFIIHLEPFQNMIQKIGFSGPFTDQSQWSIQWWEKLFAKPKKSGDKISPKPMFSVFGKQGPVLLQNIYRNIKEEKLAVYSAILKKSGDH